jgi:hypothetical protein
MAKMARTVATARTARTANAEREGHVVPPDRWACQVQMVSTVSVEVLALLVNKACKEFRE